MLICFFAYTLIYIIYLSNEKIVFVVAEVCTVLLTVFVNENSASLGLEKKKCIQMIVYFFPTKNTCSRIALTH